MAVESLKLSWIRTILLGSGCGVSFEGRVKVARASSAIYETSMVFPWW